MQFQVGPGRATPRMEVEKKTTPGRSRDILHRMPTRCAHFRREVLFWVGEISDRST